MDYNKICEMNPRYEIKGIEDESFKKFGSLVTDIDFDTIAAYIDSETDIPLEGNIYVADIELDDKSLYKNISSMYYANELVQIGYCNGNNNKLNALEYHNCKEIIYSIDDIVLILATQDAIDNEKINVKNLELFYLPKNTGIILDKGTLHFSPIKTKREGFKTIIILSKGTNTKVNSKYEGSYFAENKWLYAHKDAKKLIDNGAMIGIIGDNIEIIV